MPAGIHNFTIEQGANWQRSFTYRLKSDGVTSIPNLTGYSARMHIRKDIDASTTMIELTTANGRISIDIPTARFTLTLTSAETAALDKSGVYDLEIVSAATPVPEVTRLLEGKIHLRRNVTR